MNFLEQQAKNKTRTFWLVFMFVALLLFLGFGLDLIVFNRDFFETGRWNGMFPVFTAFALVLATVQSYTAYFSGDKIILKSTAAVEATGRTPQEVQLINVVDEMTIASGIPRPRIYIVPDADLNAFATGRDPQHASIAVTQGLLDKLNREELQAVIAHEMGHIRNYDTRLLMMLSILLGAILIFKSIAVRGRFMRGGSSRRKGGGGGGALVIIWLIAAILAPIFAQILAMAVSRQREYFADASSAELTRNPESLIRALRKISASVQPTSSIKEGYAHMCIEDPKGRAINNKSGFFSDLFATHPPIEKRIEALEKMSYLKQ